MFVCRCSKTPNVFVGLLYSFLIIVRSTSYNGSIPQGELAIEAFTIFYIEIFLRRKTKVLLCFKKNKMMEKVNEKFFVGFVEEKKEKDGKKDEMKMDIL